MILDTLGVGFLGTSTEVFHKAGEYSKIYSSSVSSTVWGRPDFRLPPTYAAFVNGVAIHSMDFDDTWYPATHPSELSFLSSWLYQKPCLQVQSVLALTCCWLSMLVLKCKADSCISPRKLMTYQRGMEKRHPAQVPLSPSSISRHLCRAF